MERQSWIRRMFEEGEALNKPRQGLRLLLGNPIAERRPLSGREAMLRAAGETRRGMHRYMANSGSWRRAGRGPPLAGRTGVSVATEHVVMTVGAAGALNCAIKALCDPGDEVIVLSPYFPEYLFYIDNHQAVCRVVPAAADFSLDVSRVRGPKWRTRIVLINSLTIHGPGVRPRESGRVKV